MEPSSTSQEGTFRSPASNTVSPGAKSRAAAGEAFRRLDLGLIQNREDLFATGLGYAHDNSPCLPALLLARRRGKRGMEVAVEGRTRSHLP